MTLNLSSLDNILPPYLHERITAYHQAQAPSSPQFILYWVRTSARTTHNPALDAAITLANHTSLPLVVYQGVDDRYPYASDRLHTFILEGAKDFATELDTLGIPHLLFVRRPGHHQDALLELAKSAAILITEEMPVEPLRSLTRRVAEAIDCPTLSIDAACLVPMPLTHKAPKRAFAFRKSTQSLREERLRTPWTPVSPDQKWRSPDSPGFDPVDLSTTSIPELVAQCDIDHSIAPVPDTPGGSFAGYARWEDFKKRHLKHYKARRNDPSQRHAVSRLSAYLHFGHISAAKIAQEAMQLRHDGAKKFLDELLIWRELAHHFCYHSKEHESLEAIPPWARETLTNHADDTREALYSLETMSRAQTDDEIWNIGQRSLLKHGELHNNFRMTWGKTVLKWQDSPQEALEALVEMNHRYALDGRDPSSYGGILWCLGQFDRPFDTDSKVFGKVRAYHTDRYASNKRIDSWQESVDRPHFDPQLKIAIVGAGLAGLFAARTLQDHGTLVHVFDKGYRPGGRCATRESQDDPTLQFDHGAQYFTLRSNQFKRLAKSWQDQGVISPWGARLASFNEPGVAQPKEGQPDRFVGTPGMRSLAEHLGKDLEHLQMQTRIQAVQKTQRGWLLTDTDDQEYGPFDGLILNTPPAQGALLLEGVDPDLAKRLDSVEMDPCWCVMVEFEDALPVDFDAAFINVEGAPLSWVAKDATKPGRPDDRQTWVLHASEAWSKANLESEKEEVATSLVRAFLDVTGQSDHPKIIHQRAHRWRYAKPSNTEGEAPLFKHLWDGEALLGLCGDWCAGGRVEGALLSGSAVAGRLLGALMSREERLSAQTRRSLELSEQRSLL